MSKVIFTAKEYEIKRLLKEIERYKSALKWASREICMLKHETWDDKKLKNMAQGFYGYIDD